MTPLRLYIKDFCCFSESEVDFSSFSNVLITGSVENSKSFSNGIGKSVIFKAIEYVLFNECEFSLDRIIRDDQEFARVGFDFEIDSVIYRVIRSRNKKGNTDLTLLKIKDLTKNYKPFINSNSLNRDGWEDISSRRTSDTEKHLESIIKMNYASFRGTVHFTQSDNDKSGLAQLTPAKRKSYLKEILSLAIYSKLEKLAKETFLVKEKQLEKEEIIIQSKTSSLQDLNLLLKNKETFTLERDACKDKLKELSISLKNETSILEDKKEKLTTIKNKFDNLSQSIKSLNDEMITLNLKNKQLTKSKEDSLFFAKDLTKKIEESKSFIDSNQKTNITPLKEKLNQLNDLIIEKSVNKSTISKDIDLLKIPLPTGSVCNHCRSELTQEHLDKCNNEINSLLLDKQNILKQINEELVSLSKDKDELIKEISLKESINQKIESNEKYLSESKPLYEDRKRMYQEYSSQIKTNSLKIEEINQSIQELSSTNIDLTQTQEYIEFKTHESLVKNLNQQYSNLFAEYQQYLFKVSANESDIENYKHNLSIINSLKESKEKLKQECKAHPYVLQAFSSNGIPNFMVQNVLNDLQAEVNGILPQLHSGLSLSFITEKTKTSEDTLDIVYHINGKERVFEQLSGAQKLASIFSLKLGLMFLLQNIYGYSCNMLLLDEVDHPLDDGSIDYYYELIRKLSDKFKVLVISHNSRFKEKMTNYIYIQQNYNKVSRIL